MAAKSRRGKSRKESPPPRRGNFVAWLALLVALVALGVALSDKPWVRDRIGEYRENWDVLVDEVERRMDRDGEAEPDPQESLEEAIRSARLEELEPAGQALERTVGRLRALAESGEGESAEEQSELADEIEGILETMEDGTEAADRLVEYRDRLAAVLGSPEG